MRRVRLQWICGILTLCLLLMLVSPATLLAASAKGKAKKVDQPEVRVHLKGQPLNGKDSAKVPYGLQKKYMKDEVGPYIIVFGGPIEESLKTEVEKIGVKLVEYLPDFSFLTLMTPKMAQMVKKLPFITDVMVYHPAFKIHPSLIDEYGQMKGYGDTIVKVSTFTKDAKDLNLAIENLRGKKLYEKQGRFVVKMNRGQLAKLAQSNDVKYIEEVPKYILLNDIAKGYMAVDGMWTLGYDGNNQVVGVCDTGLDTGVNNSTMHLDFQGRIDAIYALGRSTADDTHGHGTHVAGSVLGDGARSNGQFKGMAPAARLVFQSVLDSGGGLGGLPNDLNDLFAQAWNDGARIHTNSWGASVNDYTADSQDVDEYVWNNDMIILFAAGNDGTDSTWTQVYYDSIGTPGTAKNCITVGASENYRPTMGWVGECDNPNETAIFSSRGWTDDGRIKPDIMAPGTWILSTKSSVAPVGNYWGDYNTYYAYMGGTSMATPLTAGAVAVAREYMQAEWSHTPSPALMKAVIINGATDMGYGIPNKDQGWGRINLMDSLVNKEYKYDDETTSLTTNGTKNYSYSVESANTPLRISLVWTDYPGSTTASKALVNDLDITVTSPSGTVYYGNDFTSPYNSAYDRLNNVENVYINNPEVGTYTIVVKGYNVPNGPQPFALYASGDFGVPSGDITAPTVSITAPANGATVSNTVTYSATASDNVGVSRVEFYVDSAMVGSDTTSPYSISWDTTGVSNGSHSLEARAFDAAGNMGISSIVSVTVDNVITVGSLDEEFAGYVSSSGTADQYFYIDVTATGNISLSLSWNSSDDLDMYLYDPSDTQLTRAYTLNNPETISWNATTTGRYKIRVNAYSGSEAFILNATHPIDPNVTTHYETTGYVNNSGTRSQDYYITVGANGTINIEALWSTSADLDIFLYDPSGLEVSRAYSVRNPESISYPVSTTGTYRVKVDAYSGSADYTLKVNYPN